MFHGEVVYDDVVGRYRYNIENFVCLCSSSLCVIFIIIIIMALFSHIHSIHINSFAFFFKHVCILKQIRSW